VDDFLSKYFPQSEIRQRVLVKKAQEDIFQSLGGGSGSWVAFAVNTIHTEAYRQDIIWLLKDVASTKDFGNALKTIVRWAINKIYGEPVFNLAMIAK